MRFGKSIYGLLTALIIAVGVGPLLLLSISSDNSSWLTPQLLSAGNLLAWAFVFLLLVSKIYARDGLAKRARSLGVDPTFKPFDQLLKEVLSEIRRKNESLSINLIQQKVSNPEELTSALEKIVSRSYELLNASSAELALFDENSGLYHSAFLLGRPFRNSSQAVLSEMRTSEEPDSAPDIIVQPVIFAGTMLGTLRIALKKGTIPSSADREIANLLALQAGLALVNAEYSKQLLKMNQSSDESTKARTGFLANLSHEIRGPLGIMLNAVELILEGICGSVSEEQTRTLGMIQSNGKHLLELINDVLDYSKVESGKLYPKKIEIVLDTILKDISTIIRSQAIEKGHKLNYIKSEEALALMCDKRHLRQMLINLLTNAVKYTPEGGVIDVWAERTPGNRVKINVKDSGIGIAEEDRSKVFAPFERIENSYSMTQVGTGLGMPLTKRLAEVNSGKIDFSSIPGKGSQFWLDFPAIEVTKIIEETKEEKIQIEGKGDLILLLEKDPGERDMLSKYLYKLGFNVAGVSTKMDAQTVLSEKKVSIVVIDNNITDDPKENVVDFIRKNSVSSSMPVVLLTSRAFVSDIKKYLKDGIDRCLVKPVPLQELAQICRNLIDGIKPTNLTDIEIEAKDSKDFSQIKPPDSSETAH
ncbi:MAG: hybrid sensor histidine kinase/response regulator [bacterium]|nr:hybrid sensor histidine kinase/response regulator [bacterium]